MAPHAASPASTTRVRVWDLPTRLFHWALAACVIALVVTAKAGAMDWHFRLGYTTLALLLFRLVWGFVGGYWSRFGSFLRGPVAVMAYVRGRAGAHERIGHNPLGSLSVLAMLLVLLLQVFTGLMSDDAISFTGPLASRVPGAWSSWATDWHKDAGQWLVIALVVLHVLALAFYAVVKRERLVPAMVTGDKALATPQAVPQSRDDVGRRLLGLVLFALCAGLSVWVSRLQG
ncbi:cytochrome b/b6 domain-containing protein [uncultured Pseudacidovorax sp.]|uniref:cytochrome b/b6 domain-containing protein n=1 Tax=uncultured Pseudacidovorax sp. TaxID=679313 RepID=UPI0025E5CDE9|nr:cytochrome b/b6 domain-containing protein [uncultured Pseudacidovorax sp.]